MYLVAIGWLYVALMMAVAEATAVNGSVLGALITFLLYGIAPVALVLYLLGSPARRKARREQEQAEWQAAQVAPAASGSPDGGGEAATAAQAGGIAPVREKP